MADVLDWVDLGGGPFAAALAIIIVGAFVRGYTGFGASLIWVSGLTLLVNPDEAVPIILLLEVAASALLLPRVIGDVDWGRIRWLLAGAVIGMPVGVWILAGLPARPMQLLVSIVVLAAALVLRFGRDLRVDVGRRGVVGTGVLSGILNGATSAGGVPVIALYLGSSAGMATGRASLMAFFGATDSFGSVILGVQGLLDATALARFVAFLPAMAIGAWLGSRRFSAADPERVRRGAIWLLMALGVAGIARAAL